MRFTRRRALGGAIAGVAALAMSGQAMGTGAGMAVERKTAPRPAWPSIDSTDDAASRFYAPRTLAVSPQRSTFMYYWSPAYFPLSDEIRHQGRAWDIKPSPRRRDARGRFVKADG